jgi:hypothetical protein
MIVKNVMFSDPLTTAFSNAEKVSGNISTEGLGKMVTMSDIS